MDMNTPESKAIPKRVSVVVPTFNRAHLVVDALESAIQQSQLPLEIIIIDDGSTDETENVVKEWMGNQSSDVVVHYIKQTNQGGSAARNHGIRLAKGEFIAFLDSDDVWHREKLERQVNVMETSARIGGVYCGLRHVEMATESTYDPVRSYPRGNLLEQLLIRDVTAPTSTYLVRREVFDKVGTFDETLDARQDWDLWIRLSEQFLIEAVPEALVDYREHEGHRTISDPKREMEAYRVILEKYTDLHEKHSFRTRRKIQASYLRRMGRVSFHQGLSNMDAFGYFVRSIIQWPFDFDTYAAMCGMILPSTMRGKIHNGWNRVFGKTMFAIRSH